MYLTLYKLLEKPFNISTDPRFLWCGEKHQEALANLMYGLLEPNGYVVLTGDVGTGKTTLVNALIETLDDNALVANISHPTLDVIEFFSLVAKIYDASAEITTKTEFLLFINSFLQKSHAEGKVVLLVIDEAHRLTKELLEEIRLLSNIEHAGTKLISIFFVGQNELKELLLSPQCNALRQRISLFYEIEPLSEDETHEYVFHRLKVAGTDDQLFTTAAICEIHKFTRGYPRLINILCDRAMLTGYVRAQEEIDADIIVECSREFSFLDPQLAGPIVKKHRLGLKQVGLVSLFSLIIIAIGINLYTRSRVKDYAAKEFSEAKSEYASEVTIRGNTPTTSELTPNVTKPVHVKQVLEAQEDMPQMLNQDTNKVVEKKNALSDSAAVEAKTVPSGKVLKSEFPSEEEQLTSITATVVPVAEPLKSKQPTTSELLSVAFKMNNYQAAIDLLEALQKRDDESYLTFVEMHSRALVGRATQLLAGSPVDAELLFLKAAEVNPKNIEAHLNLGKIYIRSKDYVRAIEAYQNAVALNPKLSDAIFNLGFIYATIGMYEDAEKLYARLVPLEPPYLDKALFNLAVVQQKIGKKEECIANLKMAVTIRPENQKAQSYLKLLLVATEESGK
jgi:type II secretory pathway predicted ATPase ExeA/TolA-binding protein